MAQEAELDGGSGAGVMRAGAPWRVRDLPLVVRTIGISAVLMALYSWTPTMIAEPLFQLVAWGSIVVMIRGARRQGATSIAWPLITAGFALFAAGDLVFVVYEDILHEAPFPSCADVLYLAGYPLIASGLALLARRSRSARGHTALIEAGILVVPATVAGWVYLVDPIASDEGLTFLERSVSAAYPVFDVVCLAVLVRLLVGFVGRRSVGQPSLALLTAGFAAMLACDTWFLVATLVGGNAESTLLNASFLLPYIGVAAAACHPSMRSIGAPSPPQPMTLSRRRLAVLAFAALVTPLLLAARYVAHQDLAVPIIVAGTVVSFLLVVARMSGLVLELETSRAALQFEATHDMLTGLPNRQEFNRRLVRSLASGAPGALLFIDLDHFKDINDSFGHQAGDEVLVEVASRLRHRLRVNDIAGRLAGDEFVVLTETPDETDVLLMAERLLRDVETRRSNDDVMVRVTASIGVVHWSRNTPASEATALLNSADRAMYEAKTASGNQLAVHLGH